MKGNNGSWEREESAAKCGCLSLLKAPFLIPIKAPELHQEPCTRVIYYIHGGVVGGDQPFLLFQFVDIQNLFLFNYLCQKKMNRFGGGSSAPILYIKNAVCSCELQSNTIAHIFSSWLFRFQSKIGDYNVIFKWKELERNCTNKMFTKSASWILHIFFSYF